MKHNRRFKLLSILIVMTIMVSMVSGMFFVKANSTNDIDTHVGTILHELEIMMGVEFKPETIHEAIKTEIQEEIDAGRLTKADIVGECDHYETYDEKKECLLDEKFIDEIYRSINSSPNSFMDNVKEEVEKVKIENPGNTVVAIKVILGNFTGEIGATNKEIKHIWGTGLLRRAVLATVQERGIGSTDITVSTEAQLKAAIENATGTADNPTEIKINSNIALTESLIIQDRNIKLLGIGNDITISIDENFQYKSGTGVIYIDNTGNEEMKFSFENLIIDGRGDGTEQKWRLLATSIGSNITVNMDQSENGKTELYGCVTGSGSLGDYSGVYGSCVCISGTFNQNGGMIHTSPFGIYILSNSVFNLNDGQIDASNCSKTYHGIIFGYWQTNTSVNVHGGKIITSAGGNYSGSAISVITNFTMTGGIIQSSVINDGQRYISADNIRIGGGCVISGGGKMTAFNKAPQIISELSSANILISQQNLGNDALVARSSDNYEIQESDLAAFHDWDENNMVYMQKDGDGKNAIYTAIKRTITFNNNGGSGNMATQNIPSGIETKLTACTFTRDGYYFAGWNTELDGTGISYSDRDSVILMEDATLYAKWKICHHDNNNYAYTAEDSTLTQICGDCGHVFGTATLLAPESLTYDGLTKTAGITTSQDWVGDVPVIEYYSHNEKLNNAPMDAGVYIAQITVDDVTASLDFIIEKFNLDIVYKTDEVKKHINEKEFINPLTTTVEQSVIYTSENPDVATVDANGKVTIKGAGTTVITATVNETNDYHSSFAEYRLIVTDHEYEETWKMDKEGHWKECSICGEKKTREDHVYEEKECKICQYRKENINIDNEEKETVKTSDQNDMMKWIAVLTVSGIALLINRKQRYSRK